MSTELGVDAADLGVPGATDGPGPFESIIDRSRHPMVVATVSSRDGEPAGCLVGFHTRCSVEPPRYLVCLSTLNRTFEVASEVGTMAVHHLDAGDVDLARLFGEETGDEVDKFGGVAWSHGPGGAPVLLDVDSWWVGRIVATIPLGDHTGFVLDPIAGRAGADRAPFTADEAADFDAGHPTG